MDPRLIGHLSNTVTSYYGHFFGRPAKRPYIFLLENSLLIRSAVDMAKSFWPIGDHISRVPL